MPDRWEDVLQRITRVESVLDGIVSNDLPHIQSELVWIRDRLTRSRPSWAMMILFTALSSLCVGLLVAMVK